MSAIEDMVRKMTAKDENGVHEQVVDPKHFVSYLSCHKYCFVDHIGEERPVDMTCRLDDVFILTICLSFISMMMMIMLSKQKLILQTNQQPVYGMRKFAYSNSSTVINRGISAMGTMRKLQQILR